MNLCFGNKTPRFDLKIFHSSARDHSHDHLYGGVLVLATLFITYHSPRTLICTQDQSQMAHIRIKLRLIFVGHATT